MSREKIKVIFLNPYGALTALNTYSSIKLYNEIHGPDQQLPISDVRYGPVFEPNCVRNLRTLITATSPKLVLLQEFSLALPFWELENMWKDREMPGEVLNIDVDYPIKVHDLLYDHMSAQYDVTDYVIIDTRISLYTLPLTQGFLIVPSLDTGLSHFDVIKAIEILKPL